MFAILKQKSVVCHYFVHCNGLGLLLQCFGHVCIHLIFIFISSQIFLYIDGETFHEFCSEHKQLLHLTRITQFVDSIVFIGYCSLLIATVLTFRKGLLRFQFSQLMWTLLTIVIVVGQCKFLGTNTLNGLFWFYFPMATVVMNDVSAYFCGITMGKRFVKAPFLAISPNKTWEGNGSIHIMCPYQSLDVMYIYIVSVLSCKRSYMIFCFTLRLSFLTFYIVATHTLLLLSSMT